VIVKFDGSFDSVGVKEISFPVPQVFARPKDKGAMIVWYGIDRAVNIPVAKICNPGIYPEHSYSG